jgi:uncharacterized membrane protein YhhN
LRPLTTALCALASLGALAFYGLVGLGLATRESLPVWFTKPLLMPLLLLWLLVRVHGQDLSEIRKRGVYAGLVFATVGDIALIHASKPTFVIGMAAFGLTHFCYVGSLVRLRHVRAGLGSWDSLGLLALVAYAYLIASLVRGGLAPDLEVPFAVYGVFVLATAVSAFLRFVARGDRSSASILAGAVLFFQSDSLIAVNGSGRKLPFAGLAIMATYIAAQALIVRGVAASVAAKG